MQAMIYRRYGGPEVLRLEAVAAPTPGPNDVLVHVYAASLNAADTYLLRGQPALLRLSSGLRGPKRPILGADIAGRVALQRRMLERAAACLNPGGVLATFSCSGLVSPDLFQKVIFGASVDAQRPAQIVERLTQGADHPVLLSFPESEYLKGLVCRVF